METPLLDQLAERCGIETSYYTIEGELKHTSVETKRHFLSAMGFPAHDEIEAADSLQRFVWKPWQSALPPVQVISQSSDQFLIPLTLPEHTQLVHWTLHLEGQQASSDVISGSCKFAQLTLIDSREMDGEHLQSRQLILPHDLPCGYHTLKTFPGNGAARLIITPDKCWLPEAIMHGKKLWGFSAQLYLMRSERNWGIGDFTDLRLMVQQLMEEGADVVGLNPLHALFTDNPTHASPYSPASRLLLNVLNIDVTGIAEFALCKAAQNLVRDAKFQHALRICQNANQVKYQMVAELKLPVLRLLYEQFQSADNPERRQAFAAFCQDASAAVKRHCLFLSLRDYFAKQSDALADWHQWPLEYQNPESAAVNQFMRDHPSEVEFALWLQWIAHCQLASAAQAGQSMVLGLYRDLAVGADYAGAETWSNPQAVVSNVHVGAPPDYFSKGGQDWGLPPFNPHALREEGYQSFIDLLRANMRYAGGLRIDHVMALQHLYWIPAEQPANMGAYVQYPLQDLIRILALESHRAQCLVIGEDLGNVPPGFREHMQHANILSYRVLFFEHDADGFIPAERYPSLALAVANGHDLPTLRGWWKGADIDLMESLQRLTAERAQHLRQHREQERAAFLKVLQHENPAHNLDESWISGVYHFLARTPAVIALVQVDDIAGEVDPVNVPGTHLEHPNWSRRLTLDWQSPEMQTQIHRVSAEFRAQRNGSVEQAER